MRQLRNGDLDIAFGALGYADEFGNEIIMSRELSFSPLLKLPLTTYLRKGHPVLSDPNIENAIFDYPLIGPSPPLNIVSTVQQRHKVRGQNFRVPHILVDDFNLAAKLISKSDCWSAIYEPSLHKLDLYGDYVNLGGHDALPPITIGMVRRKTWTLSPWAEELVAIIHEVSKPWLIKNTS